MMTDYDSRLDTTAGLRVFFRIMDAWIVDKEKAMAILGVSSSAYYKWKENPENARLSREQFERLSYVFGIYKALQILFPNDLIGDSWVERENSAPLFAGKRPIDLMSTGLVADLYRVREYLEAQLH